MFTHISDTLKNVFLFVVEEIQDANAIKMESKKPQQQENNAPDCKPELIID